MTSRQIKLDQIYVLYCDNNEAEIVGKAMNRRLFFVIIAILLVVTVYMVSMNLNKLPAKRTTAPRNYIKELQGRQADVKGRNSLHFKLRRQNDIALQMLAIKCFSFRNDLHTTSAITQLTTKRLLAL